MLNIAATVSKQPGMQSGVMGDTPLWQGVRGQSAVSLAQECTDKK
ncbi:hypothetical protein [Paenibacillus wenxiniae]|uniref:Uncharacterized protein n=1 Tax=Paenibacillus wenxiniae TaxID=1636843 RepID=A0ABW4RGT9_9BACL